MCRWALRASWPRSSRASRSWHRFRNGAARRSFWESRTQKVAPPVRRERNPQNSYRNGPLYAAYTAETLNNILFLASRERINFLGAVTWAFEFEDQPYFEGFRTLATNGVDKPVLNAFRMFGLLGDERIKATSSGALPSEDVIRDGVRGQPDINVIATRKDHEVEILIWNYHDDDLAAARDAD